jgi:hypothetical protein
VHEELKNNSDSQENPSTLGYKTIDLYFLLLSVRTTVNASHAKSIYKYMNTKLKILNCNVTLLEEHRLVLHPKIKEKTF